MHDQGELGRSWVSRSVGGNFENRYHLFHEACERVVGSACAVRTIALDTLLDQLFALIAHLPSPDKRDQQGPLTEELSSDCPFCRTPYDASLLNPSDQPIFVQLRPFAHASFGVQRNQ